MYRTAMVTVCGLGFLRPAPGTWGSLPPVVVAGIYLALELPTSFLNFVLITIGAIASAACLEYGTWAEKNWGRKDASYVVADETAGQSVALLFLPWREMHTAQDWQWNIALAVLAFVLFRMADIIKPPPAHEMQRLTGGLGILIDDLIAGAYALIAMQLITRFALQPMFDVVS